MRIFIFMFIIHNFFLFGAEPKHCQLADKATVKFSSSIIKREKASLSCSGGAFIKDIGEIILGFDIKRRIDINSARRLLVQAVEEFLAQINQDEEIRPYLRNYPFKYTNLDFQFGFSDTNGNYPPEEFVALVGTKCGCVYYCTHSRVKKFYNRIYEETYTDALKIIQSEQQIQTVDPKN